MLELETKLPTNSNQTDLELMTGPCSVDSLELARATIDQAEKRGIPIIRLDLFKPRTVPRNGDGELVYTGAREAGIPWLVESSQRGIKPSTEVMTARQADRVLNAVSGPLRLWQGARNVNQDVILEIAELIAKEDRVDYMIKNPMFPEEQAWAGQVGWAIEGGLSPDRILLCYRGFNLIDNKPYRNTPLFEDMTRRVQIVRDYVQKSYGIAAKLPVIVDPSHIGKTPEQIVQLTNRLLEMRRTGQIQIEGLMIEVHPEPEKSQTDPGINWEQFDSLPIKY